VEQQRCTVTPRHEFTHFDQTRRVVIVIQRFRQFRHQTAVASEKTLQLAEIVRDAIAEFALIYLKFAGSRGGDAYLGKA
jgi:hypothetical protein